MTKIDKSERLKEIKELAQAFCSPEISDAPTLVELPNGLIIPKSMLTEPEIVVDNLQDIG